MEILLVIALLAVFFVLMPRSRRQTAALKEIQWLTYLGTLPMHQRDQAKVKRKRDEIRMIFVRAAIALGVLIGLAWIASSSGHAATPSFNCANAKAADEKAICRNDELADLDWQVWKGWQVHREITGKADANRYAKGTLRERKACGPSIPCIRAVQKKAIAFYARQGEAVPESDGMMVAEPAAATATGNWQIHSWVDSMDDRKQAVASVTSSSGASLNISCDGGAWLRFPDEIMDDGVTVRIDRDKPFYASTKSYNGHFDTLHMTGWGLGGRLSKASSLRVRGSVYAGAIREEVFDVRGGKGMHAKLRAACK